MKRMLSLLLAAALLAGFLVGGATYVSAETEENVTESVPEETGLRISDECIEMIKEYEGFRKYPYSDYTQYSIGYGSRCPADMLDYYREHGITEEEAEVFVNAEFDAMAKTKTLKAVADKNNIKVENLTYGSEKNIILSCHVETPDVYEAVKPRLNQFMSANVKKANSTMFKSALDFKMEFEPTLIDLINSADLKSSKCEISIYDTKEGLKVYASDEAVDTVFGGTVKLNKEIEKITTYTLAGGETREILSGNVNKGLVQCLEVKRETSIPDTAGPVIKAWNKLKYDFHRTLIEHDNWKSILKGLWTTIKLTIFALLIGIILGFLVAFVR